MYLQYGKKTHAAGFSARLFAAADRLVQRLGALYQAFQGHRTARTLSALDERTLDDIGLSRADVDRALYSPLSQDPRSDLMVARFNRINSRKRPIRRKR